jgi:integrase
VASVNKYVVDGYECHKLVDTSSGRRIQYAVKLDKFTERQWLAAHNDVMASLSPEDRQNLANARLKEVVLAWLQTPKEGRANAKQTGIKIQGVEAKGETSIEKVFVSYLSNFCREGINTELAQTTAKRQCRMLLSFLKERGIKSYSTLKRDALATYPEWRNCNNHICKAKPLAADTINRELERFSAIIRHGVKYCGWQERYLLDGVKVKPTPQNTKAIKPFEISEARKILAWLWDYSQKYGWHLHDMVLLALCSGLEAKALHLLCRDWFKLDLGILRVYDKLVSGVIDAKTQNRARDIPLTPTLRKIFERGYVFKRDCHTNRKSAKEGGTEFRDWAENTLLKAERGTGIADINLHRFRHTCATARLSAGWQLIRVSRMLGHSNVNITASHYAEFDLSASPAGFEGMLKVYGDFVRWLDEGYFK